MSLLTIGTVAFDDIETPYGKAERVVGGAALYAGLAASYFTPKIQLVSVIGEDYDEKTLQLLRDRGVDIDGIEVVKGGKSFFWAGKYHTNMNSRDTLTTELNVLADFNPILPEKYKNAEFVLLGNLTPDVQMQVINQLTSKPKLIAMDTMNFWMDIAMDSLKNVLKKIDLLTINEEEARQLSGEHSLVKAAKVIHAMGPQFLVIKKGEHGALLFHEEGVFFAPALPLEEVFDPTGAGDTFAGGFMGYIAATGDISFTNMKRAIIYGSAMASFCVEQFSIKAIENLNKEAINKRVSEFESLTRFDTELEW
jgi:sugar/nucleoside kinase (ribokinase family)